MGGVDTQQSLPFGSAAGVRRETCRLLDAMTAEEGGYILVFSHTVPPEMPNDNAWAMNEKAGIAREEIFDRAAVIRVSTRPAPA